MLHSHLENGQQGRQESEIIDQHQGHNRVVFEGAQVVLDFPFLYGEKILNFLREHAEVKPAAPAGEGEAAPGATGSGEEA